MEDPNLDIIFDDNIRYNYTDINAKIGSSRLHFGRALADDPRHQEGEFWPQEGPQVPLGDPGTSFPADKEGTSERGGKDGTGLLHRSCGSNRRANTT